MLLKKRAGTADAAHQGDPLALAEALLAVHGAINEDWLVDAAAMAAERALGATRLLVYLLNNEGHLVGRMAAAEARRMADTAFEDAAGVGLMRKRFALNALPAFEQVARTGQPVVAKSLAAIYPAWFTESSAQEAQRALGIRSICLAPLSAGGQCLGVAAFMLPYEMESPDLAAALALHIARALTNLRETQRMGELGHIDALTGAYDERRLTERLAQEANRARRYGRKVSLLLIRLENHAEISRRYGQFLSQAVLRQVGGVLYDEIRESDFLGKYKDHGFAVILTETDAEGAQGAARRLIAAAANAQVEERLDVQPMLAVGSATAPDDGTAPDVLLAVAAQRLQDASGRSDEGQAALG